MCIQCVYYLAALWKKNLLNILFDPNEFICTSELFCSCCVDEVAAQHYNADALVHYGRSCLSQPCKMPVLFVFGRQLIDVDDCCEKFRVLFLDAESNVIVMYDTVFEYACGKRSLIEQYVTIRI